MMLVDSFGNSITFVVVHTRDHFSTESNLGLRGGVQLGRGRLLGDHGGSHCEEMRTKSDTGDQQEIKMRN